MKGKNRSCFPSAEFLAQLGWSRITTGSSSRSSGVNKSNSTFNFTRHSGKSNIPQVAINSGILASRYALSKSCKAQISINCLKPRNKASGKRRGLVRLPYDYEFTAINALEFKYFHSSTFTNSRLVIKLANYAYPIPTFAQVASHL